MYAQTECDLGFEGLCLLCTYVLMSLCPFPVSMTDSLSFSLLSVLVGVYVSFSSGCDSLFVSLCVYECLLYVYVCESVYARAAPRRAGSTRRARSRGARRGTCPAPRGAPPRSSGPRTPPRTSTGTRPARPRTWLRSGTDGSLSIVQVQIPLHTSICLLGSSK